MLSEKKYFCWKFEIKTIIDISKIHQLNMCGFRMTSLINKKKQNKIKKKMRLNIILFPFLCNSKLLKIFFVKAEFTELFRIMLLSNLFFSFDKQMNLGSID